MLLGSAGTTAAWPPKTHTHQQTSGEEWLEQTDERLLSNFLVFADFDSFISVSLSFFVIH